MARFAHLTFVQGALRQAAFMNPRATVSALASVDGARALLLGLWQIVKGQAADEGEEADLDLHGLSVHTASVQAYPCAIVTFPEAVAAGEAHFAALVLRSRMADDGVCLLDPPLHFFTLEKAHDDPALTDTEICMWRSDGTRLLICEGPPPRVEAFAEAVAAVVQGLEQAD